MNIFEFVIEIIGWIQIAFSPLLLFGIVGFLIYVSEPNTTRLIIGIIVSFIGLVIGILLATKAWKKLGTMHFLSRVSASPELDNLEDNNSERTT